MTEEALDAFTGHCHTNLIARASELVNGRPEGMTFPDGATAVLGGLVGALVHAAGAAMPRDEDEDHGDYVLRIVDFLYEGIREGAPVFLAEEDEAEPCEHCGGPGGDGPRGGADFCPVCAADWSAAL